jgi:hypothetical protein
MTARQVGAERFSIGWPSFLVGGVFLVLHLAFQIFALLQSYHAGMAHFDDPLSRQAAWESRFWERATTVTTFPLVRLWEHLPLPWRTYSFVEWGLLTANSFLWAAVLVLTIRGIGNFFTGEDEG